MTWNPTVWIPLEGDAWLAADPMDHHYSVSRCWWTWDDVEDTYLGFVKSHPETGTWRVHDAGGQVIDAADEFLDAIRVLWSVDRARRQEEGS
jgi:hypothetical protein